MVTVTKEQINDLWICSIKMEPDTYSHGACQTWSGDTPPDGYAWISKEWMTEYYKETDANGERCKSAGHVDMEFDDCEDTDGNPHGKIVTKCVFSDEKYHMYQDSKPNPVTSIVNEKIAEAQNKPTKLLNTGIEVNSINVATTFVNIDGIEEPTIDADGNPIVPKFVYNQAIQDELLKAYVSCQSGLQNYTLKLQNKKAVKLPAEAIYRLYVECETSKRMFEAYSEVYIEFLASHKNDARDQEDVVSSFEYGVTELPIEYQNKLQEMQNEIMTEMTELANSLGITG